MVWTEQSCLDTIVSVLVTKDIEEKFTYSDKNKMCYYVSGTALSINSCIGSYRSTFVHR